MAASSIEWPGAASTTAPPRPAATRNRGSIPPRPRGPPPMPQPAWPMRPGFTLVLTRLSPATPTGSARQPAGPGCTSRAHREMAPADGTDGDSKLAATPAGSNANADRRARVYRRGRVVQDDRRPELQGLCRSLGARHRGDRGERHAPLQRLASRLTRSTTWL